MCLLQNNTLCANIRWALGTTDCPSKKMEAKISKQKREACRQECGRIVATKTFKTAPSISVDIVAYLSSGSHDSLPSKLSEKAEPGWVCKFRIVK